MLISAEQKSKTKNAFLLRRRVYISIQDKKPMYILKHTNYSALSLSVFFSFCSTKRGNKVKELFWATLLLNKLIEIREKGRKLKKKGVKQSKQYMEKKTSKKNNQS